MERERKTRPWVHLVRACMWPALVPVIVYFGWHTSVFVIFLYSTYANFAGDLGVWKAARTERKQDGKEG